METEPNPTPSVDVRSLERPHPNLLLYYGFTSLVLGPFFFLLLLPRFFRYRTLHYTFDDEGVSMRWGMLFRREIHLTFARIQDIHLTSNFVERWFGLGRVLVQTASGSSKAEMTIEGLQEFEAVRDFLYSRMRGVRGEAERAGGAERARRRSAGSAVDATVAEELATTLLSVANELRAVRRELAARGPGGEGGSPSGGEGTGGEGGAGREGAS